MVTMYGLKDVTLVGKYVREALGTAQKKVDSTLDNVYEMIAGSYFGDISNPASVRQAITDPVKYDAVYRNIFADTSGGLGRRSTPPSNADQKFVLDWQTILSLAAAGFITFNAVGYAMKKDPLATDIDGSIAYLQAQFSGLLGASAESVLVDVPQPPLSPTPVVNESAVVKETPTPTKYVLKYQTPDNHEIIITGNSMQFMEDTVKVIEYGYRFSPVFSLKNTKTIGVLSEKINRDMGGGNGGTDINASAMHKWIERGLIETVVREAAHEEGHNYFTTYKNDSSEKSADIFRDAVRESLSSVNETEVKEFTENFDFSKWEKQIKVQK